MKKFQYQIVRYEPDKTTGEFVNVGVVLYEPEGKLLDAKFIGKASRVTQFFGGIDGKPLMSRLKDFHSAIMKKAKLQSGFMSELQNESLESITGELLSKDDTTLYCTSVRYGSDVSTDLTLHHLFERVVNKYNTVNKPAHKPGKTIEGIEPPEDNASLFA